MQTLNIFALLWPLKRYCCPSDGSHARVINVEKPVEAHVYAEWHVDKVFVLLLQAVVDGRQAVDDVGDGQLTVVGEFVLLESVLSYIEV